MRLRGRWRLAALALVLALAGPASATSIQDVANSVSLASYTAYLDSHLYTHNGDSRGFDTSGSPRYPAGAHDSARDYIYSQFGSFGLATTLDPFSFTSGGSTYQDANNVVGVKMGTTRPGDIYILGAHYDSVQNPGADDNASGVAGVLEAARVLSQYQFNATLVFVAFDGEEAGLCGSTHYVGNVAGQNILGMISLDMLAYNPVGDHHDKAYIYGRDASNTIKQALAGAMTTYSGGITPEIGGNVPYSDQAPFEAQGWQACLLIEHAAWSNPVYHTQADSADTAGYLDYAYATDMTRGAVAYAAGAAGIVAEPATLLWTGSTDNKWDIGQTANWSAAGAARVYSEGSPIVFGDTGANTQSVDITGTVHPASVLVNNNAVTVVLGGAGSIAGPCKLTKTGGGTLILSGANTYSGGTEVSGGPLLVNNITGSGTGTGAVTVGAATLGGTGFINGPVTLTGDSTLTSTGTLTINNTLTIKGLANQLASGTVVTTGDVTIDPGAVFIVNGTLAGDSGSLIIYGTLMGKGTVNKPCTVEGGGVLSPGAPSTIQSMAQMRVGAGAQNLSFEIGAAEPNYAVPSNSLNDLLRLTDAAAPFADATGATPAHLMADTVIEVYFLSDDPVLGDYKAQFFASTDFSEAIADATYQYWRLDPRGSRYHNGNLYSPLDASLVDWSVVPETATFDGEATRGYITEFTVAPEPATLSLLALGGLALLGRKRK